MAGQGDGHGRGRAGAFGIGVGAGRGRSTAIGHGAVAGQGRPITRGRGTQHGHLLHQQGAASAAGASQGRGIAAPHPQHVEEGADHLGGFQGVNQGFDPGYGDYDMATIRNRGRPRRAYRLRGGRGVPMQRGSKDGRPGRGAGRSSYAAAATTQPRATTAAMVQPNADGVANHNMGISQDQQRMEEEVTNAGAGGHLSKPKECGGTEEIVGKSKLICGRCSQEGHVTTDCTNEVYCYICDGHDHVNHRCPVLKLPKPVVHAVGFSVDGLGFHHIPHAPLPRRK